jgi:hypothetical protein
MALRVGSLVLAFIVVATLIGLAGPPTALFAAPPETTYGARAGRSQFGAVGSDAFIVWEDRAVLTGPPPRDPKANLVYGSSNLFGIDLRAGKEIVVNEAAGDQSQPAIAGSIVVWQESGCFGCDRDVRGKDLATGQELAIATGPAEQGLPAIAGKTVVWLEQIDTKQRLLLQELGSPTVTEITAVTAPATTILPPVITDALVVWAQDAGTRRTLLAYERATGRTQVIAESSVDPDIGIGAYDAAGQQVVWTQTQLWLTDLAAATTTLLYAGRAVDPAIDEAQVVWNTSLYGAEPAIFGMDLSARRPLELVGGPAYKRGPQLAGGRLLWLGQENGQGRVRSTSRADAFAQGVERPRETPIRPQPTPPGGLPTPTPVQPTATMPGGVQPIPTATPPAGAPTPGLSAAFVDDDLHAFFTRPTYKGIHAPNAWGWEDPAAWNAFQSGNPFFGSVVVLQSDLGHTHPTTGQSVASLMESLENQGVRVVVRLFPTSSPSQGPDHVGQKVVALAQAHDWIEHIQVDNEPNLEWPASGNYGGICPWTSRQDPCFYDAIGRFYTDAWHSIEFYKNNHSNATVRARIAAMQRWSPPLADIYGLIGNQSMYNWLQGMVFTYSTGGGLAYHTYPAPNYDTTASGGITNNSWPWMDPWLQERLDPPGGGAPPTRSMITEFGWNPGQLGRCGYTQTSIWVAAPGASGVAGCSTNDGYTHRFEQDIAYFLGHQRHRAEVVAVWLIHGGDGEANGVTNGILNYWLYTYQRSSP